MYCSTCGNKLADGALFCSNCGTPINQLGTPSPNVAGQPVIPSAYYAQPAPPVMTNAPVPLATNSMQNSGKPSRHLNVFEVVSAIVFIIAIFLPYVSASLLGARAEKSLIDGRDGIFFIVIGLGMFILSLIKREIPSLVIGTLAVGLVILEALLSFRFNDNEYKELLSRGIGYYLLLFSSLAYMGASIYGMFKRQKGR